MSFADRLRLAVAAISGQVVTVSGWGWRGGLKSATIFDGSKFNGAMRYPSTWDLDTAALRDRSRVAYYESTQARALLGRLVSNVVGTGLTLELSPIWGLIGTGMSEDERTALVREIEMRFHLWASSREADATGRMSFYELQSLEFLNRLLNGEQVAVFRYSGNTGRMNPLSIQFVDPAQIATPIDSAVLAAIESAGNTIVDGVELSPVGEEVAFHVMDPATMRSTRIPVRGPSGRRFVVHPAVVTMPGQVRGVPVLAPLIHELKKITDYTVAELEATVLNAVLAVWIKPGPDKPSSQVFRGVRTRGDGEPGEGSGYGDTEAKIDKPGLIVQRLRAGEEIQSFDTKRPNVNFEAFVRGITKSLSGSLGIPIEVLDMSFNANYSASRASLLLFWNEVDRWRGATASQFLNPVFEAWFSEEISSGRVSAPGFSGSSPVIRRAWLNCSWIGTGKPSIDPLKEANAARVRIEDGLTTHEREAMIYNGSDFLDNAGRLKIENDALGKTAPAAPAPAPAQDMPPEENEDHDEKQDEEEAEE